MHLAAAAARPDAIERTDADLARAERLLAAGRADQARALFTMHLDGPRAAAARRLAVIDALGRGDSANALALARTLTQGAPEFATGWMLLGRALKAQGALQPAAEAYRRALALEPTLASAQVSLGIVLRHLHDLDGAIACHRAALALQPGMAAAHANLGIALAARVARGGGEAVSAEAVQAMQAAVQAAPRDITARQNLGLGLAALGRHDDAAEQLNAALALDPTRVDSCLMLVALLERARWHHGAREVCERWLSLNPLHAEVASRLCTVLLALNDFDAAHTWAQRALPLAPDMPELRHNVAQVLEQRLDVAGALRHLEHACTHSPAYLPAWQVRAMMVNYLEDDPAAVLRAQRDCGERIAQAASPLPARTWRVPAPDRPLRVGLVSGDLRRHSVAYFIEPLLREHDPSRLALHLYSTSDEEDAVSVRLKARAAGWVGAARLDDDTLARRIADDEVDLLVDLSGHTAAARSALFARRAAPVQVSWLGYPTSTGLPAMDWRLTDEDIDPPGDEPGASERLLRIPGGMFCFRPETGCPDAGPLPALQGGGEVTFGSFNNLAKASPQTLALWARVLAAVPDSRLMVKARGTGSAGVLQRLRDAMQALGVAPQRVLACGWRDSLAGHLAAYAEVDIALDTVPYNGATTTCEALWMGVPVVTLAGRTHAGRVGASLLRAAGMPEAVAEDADAYVRTAARWAADLPALAECRMGLRDRLRRSRLMDERGFAQAVTDVLWQAAREGPGDPRAPRAHPAP
jgi:predicted O-linked N-acetylglucosamine transferase (SPINDLY family)